MRIERHSTSRHGDRRHGDPPRVDPPHGDRPHGEGRHGDEPSQSQPRVRGRGARSHRKRSRVQQGELAFREWGGARCGAGRKPKGERPLVPHDKRPDHKARFPVLITTRVAPGCPSLRRPGEAARIRAAFIRSNESARIQVVHHSIQSNHLHLIVEAADRRALTRGVQGLLVRIARALNRLWNRTGRVFADRFHERSLRNPRQVRNALVYVLQNLRKHGIHLHGPDPFSSAPEFDGWSRGVVERRGPRLSRASGTGGGGSRSAPIALLRAARSLVPRPKTWMLALGWRRHGLIDPNECPLRM